MLKPQHVKYVYTYMQAAALTTKKNVNETMQIL
jgi:hypothetical protein